MAKEYDFIIVGQGLAGTCLARALHKLDQAVLVIDSSKLPSSSKVAAGLFNPITGRNMVLTWRVNEIFPFLQEFYKDLEELLKVKFLNMLPLYRPFASNEDLNEWQGRLSQEKFKAYIDQVVMTQMKKKSLFRSWKMMA